MRGNRIYLDYNATTPICDPAKLVMQEVINDVGNPSSVHLEGRNARAILEKAREQVAEATDSDLSDVIFSSGATEGAKLLLKSNNVFCSGIEHSCVLRWATAKIPVEANGLVKLTEPQNTALQMANSETGIIQESLQGAYMSDVAQAVGKIPFSFKKLGINSAILSAHKFGGPKGIGAVLLKSKTSIESESVLGGQERGYRAGTENLIGIAGLGAAIEFAKKQIDDGVWEEVRNLRDYLEDEVANSCNCTSLVGKSMKRLPNTSFMVTPGWKGETQVIQMDLNGFAISSGSACSSGKVRKSSVLEVMGYKPKYFECGIRVSIGPNTTIMQIKAFVKAWSESVKNRGNILVH